MLTKGQLCDGIAPAINDLQKHRCYIDPRKPVSFVGSKENETIDGNYNSNHHSNEPIKDLTIEGGYGNDTIFSTPENDHLYNTAASDRIEGGNGDDTIEATLGGNNELLGESSRDILRGDHEGDTYTFSWGHGADTINKGGINNTAKDIIQFTSHALKDVIALCQNENGLLAIAYGDTDRITAMNQAMAGIETAKLAEGTCLTSTLTNTLIQQMSAFVADKGIAFSSIDDVKGNHSLMNMMVSAWHG